MLEPAGDVEVNGEPSARRPLRSGDELRLGEHRFVLQASGLRPPSVLQDVRPAPARTWLRWAIGLGAVGAAGAAGYYWLWPLLGSYPAKTEGGGAARRKAPFRRVLKS